MGGQQSKPKPKPIPLLTETPWRSLSQSGTDLENSIIKAIKNIKTEKTPRVLLLGPVGAGKSSFVNACMSISAGCKLALSQTGRTQTGSVTRKLWPFSDSELLKNFCFEDIMGIEPDFRKGVHEDDVLSILKGHVKDNYEFRPGERLTPDNKEFYNSSPNLEDKVHCFVLVIDAKVIHDDIPKEYSDKIKWLLGEIKKCNVPIILVLTKADTLCEMVKQDKGNMFHSIKVKRAVDVARNTFDIETGLIHPVVNYGNEIELSTSQNIPILLALRQILNTASAKVKLELLVNHQSQYE